MILLNFNKWNSSTNKKYHWNRLYLISDNHEYFFWTPIIIGKKRNIKLVKEK